MKAASCGLEAHHSDDRFGAKRTAAWKGWFLVPSAIGAHLPSKQISTTYLQAACVSQPHAKRAAPDAAKEKTAPLRKERLFRH
jgi:hypothetical protein